MDKLLDAMLGVVEMGCAVAQCIRSDPNLLAKLTEEKTEGKNERFNQDFKTLADVLIQEAARHRLSQSFPSATLYGEEDAEICNAEGKSVTISVSDSAEANRAMLVSALAGDEKAAEPLLSILQNEFAGNGDWLQDIALDLPDQDLGFWIDPIDGTNVFVSPQPEYGLECVTVLLGAFSLSTGKPIIGLVGQPFAERVSEGVWTSALFWAGQDAGGRSFHSPNLMSHLRNSSIGPLRILTSSSDKELAEHLRSGGAEVSSPPGAGYKALSVIRGQVDAYVVRRKTCQEI